PELATAFIVDLALTGLLALPVLVALLPPMRPRIVLLSRVGLAAVVAYLALCSAGRILATEALAQEASRAATAPDFVYLFPEPLGPHRWRGVIRRGDSYAVYLVHAFSGRVELRERVDTAPDDPRVARSRATPLRRRLDRFL